VRGRETLDEAKKRSATKALASDIRYSCVRLRTRISGISPSAADCNCPRSNLPLRKKSVSRSE
jgi:hypothetical protein